MLEYKGIKYSLNDTPNLKAKDFTSAKLEVERIINEMLDQTNN